MTVEAADRPLSDQVQQLDGMIESFNQSISPAAQTRFAQIMQTLLEFHGEGLRRVLDTMPVQTRCELAKDEVVSGLMLLHDLHPDDMQTRLDRVMVSVQKYAASHGGRIELVEVTTSGELKLRLEGSCHGCPSSSSTLENLIKTQIQEAVPEITSITVEGLAEEPTAAGIPGIPGIPGVPGVPGAPDALGLPTGGFVPLAVHGVSK